MSDGLTSACDASFGDAPLHHAACCFASTVHTVPACVTAGSVRMCVGFPLGSCHSGVCVIARPVRGRSTGSFTECKQIACIMIAASVMNFPPPACNAGQPCTLNAVNSADRFKTVVAVCGLVKVCRSYICRRHSTLQVYIGNLVGGLVTEEALRQLFNNTMAAAFPDQVGCWNWHLWAKLQDVQKRQVFNETRCAVVTGLCAAVSSL